MVNIVDITRDEENKKLKVKRINDLLNDFFDKPGITKIGWSIYVRENNQSSSFLDINILNDKMILSISDKDISKYTANVINFAKEYEKRFNTSVVLQTDYSKK